jgi:hypothetical protein
MEMILYVMCESSKFLDNELFSSLLDFANALLKGGNVEVQKTVYQFFITYGKSELVF